MPVKSKFNGGVVYHNEEKGKDVVLLNKSGKIGKYSAEMKENKRYTNAGEPKIDEKTGEHLNLTKEQRAYRAGFLNACKEDAKIHNKKYPAYRRKTETKVYPGRYGFPPRSDD